MIVIRNRVIPFPGYKCINICGILFARPSAFLSEKTLNHERIHTAQILEMLVIGFYLWYLLEYLYRRLRKSRDPYHDVSFEEEAYGFEADFEYLSHRKPYQWLKFL